ncbi:MAG: hypothetical protein R8K21_04990 [Mariprofundales bacterium]
MILTWLKWGALLICISSTLLTLYFFYLHQQAAWPMLTSNNNTNSQYRQKQLSIEKMDVRHHGKFYYRLQAVTVTEEMARRGFLQISALRYLDLKQVSFDCYISGLGMVQFQAEQAQTDILMNTMRMNTVLAHFDNGITASINEVTIKMMSGKVLAKKVLLIMPNKKQQRLLDVSWNMLNMDSKL